MCDTSGGVSPPGWICETSAQCSLRSSKGRAGRVRGRPDLTHVLLAGGSVPGGGWCREVAEHEAVGVGRLGGNFRRTVRCVPAAIAPWPWPGSGAAPSASSMRTIILRPQYQSCLFDKFLQCFVEGLTCRTSIAVVDRKCLSNEGWRSVAQRLGSDKSQLIEATVQLFKLVKSHVWIVVFVSRTDSTGKGQRPRTRRAKFTVEPARVVVPGFPLLHNK